VPAATQETTGRERQIRTLVSCPKCGADNPPDTRHCQNCGASMAGASASRPEKATEKKGFFSRLFGKRG